MSDRTNFRSALSPDLMPLLEKAEKFMDEGLYLRARALYQKLLDYLPGENFLLRELENIDAKIQSSESPAAEGSDATVVSDTLSSLLKDLGLGSGLSIPEEDTAVCELYESFKLLSNTQFLRNGFDVALYLGVSENWDLALDCLNRLQDLGDDHWKIQLWKLKCLVEMERHPEAIAVFASSQWPEAQMIHVNYLLGLSYEALSIREQAKLRFEAVFRSDPNYRKIGQKILNY